MTNFLIPLLLFSTFFLSCSANDRQIKSEATKDTSIVFTKHAGISDTVRYFKIDKDSITVLPFEIGISLSPKAKDKIIHNKETIIVNVSLTGSPKDSTLRSRDGNFYVAWAEQEITYGQFARFDHIKFSRKVYDQLTDKDVNINVFFYSGRKSSKDNLLDGDLLSDRISNVVNKQFTLKGRLIYGDD
jgi:hypothetical protein